MLNLPGTLYGGVFVRPENYAAWGLSFLVERLPMSQARWCILTPSGGREIAKAGVAVLDASGEFSTLRIEVLEPTDSSRHEFTWQRGMPTAFTDIERRALTENLEHLVSAERLSRRLLDLLREARGGNPEPIGFAITDTSGRIESADRTFEDYLVRYGENWSGQSLPFEVSWNPMLPTHGLPYRGLFFRIDLAGDKFHVRVRKDRRTPSVSNREMEVARKLAGGLTFREIAGELGLALSTVSTHTYNLYDKLGIRRRSQLVEWVHQQKLR